MSRLPRPITNSGDEPNIQSATSTWCEVNSAVSPPDIERNTRQLAMLLLAARLHGPQRARLVDHVAVPLRVNVVHVAQNALVHHLLHGLVEVAVAALQSGLQDLLGMLRAQRAQAVHFLGLEHQALLAEDVLAGLSASFVIG